MVGLGLRGLVLQRFVEVLWWIGWHEYFESVLRAFNSAKSPGFV